MHIRMNHVNTRIDDVKFCITFFNIRMKNVKTRMKDVHTRMKNVHIRMNNVNIRMKMWMFIWTNTRMQNVNTHMNDVNNGMGWLRLVGFWKLQVSFAEYRPFCGSLLQKRPMILRSLIIVATPYEWCQYSYECYKCSCKKGEQWYKEWEVVILYEQSHTCT